MLTTRPRVVFALLAMLLAAGTIIYLKAQPPAALPADAPPGEFSATRAHEHSFVVAAKPHAAGTEALEQVRDYLVDTLRGYGLDVELQMTSWPQGCSINYVENVLARIPGTANQNPFVITAHYDSVATGPGAADDGSGTVVMLEMARALKAGPPFKNDLVFVFTSDEERGQGGARASMDHPWLAHASAVLGYEARGSYGPAFMFETSDGNGALIREMIAAGTPVQANSLMYEVHHRTPNSTDLAAMKERGAVGYNIAFVGGLYNYHSENDNPENLNPASLQHQGNAGMALARHYGNRTGTVPRMQDWVFFNTLGDNLTGYPIRVSRLISLASGLLALITLALACALRAIRLRGLLAGLFLPMAACGVAGGAGWILLRQTYRIRYVFMLYDINLFLAAFLFIAMAIVLAFYRWAARRFTGVELFSGAMLLWGTGLAACEWYMPVGSFIVAWPLLGCSLGLAATLIARRFTGNELVPLVVLTAASAPLLLFLIPGIQSLHYIGGALTLIPNMLLLVAGAAPLAPVLSEMPRLRHTRWLAPALIVIAAAFLARGWTDTGFTAKKQRFNSLSYVSNMESGKALWLCTDRELDAWTREYFGDNPRHEGIADVWPDSHAHCFRADAPAAKLAGPQLDIVEDTLAEGLRAVRLRYTSPRRVAQAYLSVLPPARVFGAICEGHEIPGNPHGRWGFEYRVMPRSGVSELTLKVAPDTPLRVRIEEMSFDMAALADVGYKERPDWCIVKPNTLDWWERVHLVSGLVVVVDEFHIGKTPDRAVTVSRRPDDDPRNTG